MLDFKILTSEAEVDAIADEWRQLYARVRKSPINDYDRFRVLWRTVGQHKSQKLHIVTGRKNGQLVGLIPLTVHHRKGLRILQSDNGAGPECDLLSEDEATAIELWKAARNSPHYDFAKIRGIYPDTVCARALASFATPRDTIDFFYLESTWPSSKEWLASLSGNTRGNFRRCTRRLEEKGGMVYEVWQGGELPHDIIERMVAEKIKWSMERGKEGPFRNPHIADYFRQLINEAAQQKILFLAWLRCGTETIAYNFGLVDQGVLHAIFWTYDPAWSQYSPGNVVLVNSISWAIDQGLKGVNFMYTTDSESEKYFKRKYSNLIRPCHEYTFSGNLKGMVMEKSFFALRVIKRGLLNALGALRKKEKPATEAKTAED